MNPIARAEVKLPADYERIRPRFRARVLREKERRRVQVGDLLSLHFENRDTVLFQIQEMLRIEHITQEDKVQHEIDVYNDLVPGQGELSATLFIEVTRTDRIKPVLDRFMGIDKGRRVFLRFDGTGVAGKFEAGHTSPTKVSAVHYVRFRFTPEQAQAFRRARQVAVVVRHPGYEREAPVPPQVHAALVEDLEAP